MERRLFDRVNPNSASPSYTDSSYYPLSTAPEQCWEGVRAMFLTGFDATTLNTLFVDKNLRAHGLI